MAAVGVCTDSVFDMVTCLAKLLDSEEEATSLPTAAALVSTRRSKIYGLLLRSGTMSSQNKLELLWETKNELEEDPKRRYTLQSVLELMEGKKAEDSQDTEQNVESSPTKVGSRLLKPGMLKLEAQPIHMEPITPKVFRSVDQMNQAQKPLRLRVSCSDSIPINLQPLPQTNPNCPTMCFLASSMARMMESRAQSLIPSIHALMIFKRQRGGTRYPAYTNKKSEFVAEKGPEKHFFSDHMLTNEMNLKLHKQLVLNYIRQADLIDHLKKAAAGLQSETFMCSPEDDMELQIRPNTTMRSVLPKILADFSDPFLRAGCAYRRLSARTRCHSYTNARLERPLNRALREILVEFLATSRQFLLSQSAGSLPQLLLNSRTAMQLLRQLESVFDREPRLNLEAGVPGCFLMSCIWQVIDTCGNSDFLQLLIYLLRRMSQTYFVQLQRWIYHGELDEELNEIFISRYQYTSPSMINECSKDFFNRGHKVNIEEIPAFLSGCEQDILQCGKYNRVLKAYNPQHPVFDVKFPDIVVCLTEQQLKDMRRRLHEKYAVIYQRFGWCSMQSIFQERMAAKRNFRNLMVERTEAHLAAWAKHQRVLQLEADAQKKLRYDQLNAEMEAHQQNVLERRRQEIVNELVFLRESDRLEEKRQLLEKETLQKKVAHLQDLLSVETKSQDFLSVDTKSLDIFSVETKSQYTVSPDDSSNGDRSFQSCFEGSSSSDSALAESVIDKDDVISEKESEAGADHLTELPNVVQFQQRPLDVINSNEQLTLQSDLERNRKHILSSEHFQAMVDVKQSDDTTSITSSHSGLRARLPPDINANMKGTETDQLTDFQENRLRMQHHDAFTNYNSTDDENTQRIQRQMQSTTERAMNRRKVMASEYEITLGKEYAKQREDTMLQPLELNKLHVEVALSVLTPMSITSDADFGALSPETADKDAVNNNNSNNNETERPISLKTMSPHPHPHPHLGTVKAVNKALDSFTPTFHLPTNFQMERNKREAETVTVPDPCNPFMARRCLQLSVMGPVNAHYTLLRNEVLRIFKELRIYEHFRRLRNYFFLLDGQFGGMLTSDILGRIRAGIDPKNLFQKGVLDAMLSNALAGCAADETMVTHNLTLNRITIPDKLDFLSLDATSMLMLHCKVDWPLNLVISSETIAKYGQIFGHLLKLRHVSFILEGTYEHLQVLGKLLGPELRMSAQYRHLQMVRHKLSHFVTSLQTHLVAKALQATWKSFKEDLCTANSIEDLYKHHVSYLKRVAFLAFLNRRSAKVKETIDNMLIIVLRFCKVIQSQSFIMDLENQFIHPRFRRLLQEEAEFEKFMHYLIYLGNKATASGYQEEIGDLICIINFNNYYIVSDLK